MVMDWFVGDEAAGSKLPFLNGTLVVHHLYLCYAFDGALLWMGIGYACKQKRGKKTVRLDFLVFWKSWF